MTASFSFAVYRYIGTKRTDITNLVKSINWGGSVSEAGRKCEIALKNTHDGDSKIISDLECGHEIRCSKRGTEFFRGTIFKTDISSKGDMSLLVWDSNYYLAQNMDTKKFVKKKASQVLQELCKQYSIPYGHIDDTGYIIPKLILREKSLYEMITIALTDTRKKTGKVFMLHNEQGKITLRERKTQMVQLIISDGTNLLSANYSESIEELKNSVRITGKSGEDAKGVSVSDASSIKKYGTMRVKQHESEMTDAQLKPIAQALLKELNVVAKESNVEAIGDTSIKAGRSIRVYEHMTGISGGFYVTADDHTFEANGTHRMSLVLSRTLDVAELDYEPPEENTESTNTSSGGSSSSGGGNKSSGGGSSSNSGGNTKRQKVVSMARSYKGRLRYVFGGKSITNGTGDCSGFTNFIYRNAVGLNIGHGTSSQITKGVKISTSEAEPGDIVFFQGTYRSGVSHVGIVTSKGMCVSLASSGCKEHSYTSGYWGSHFMQIRRVLS